MRLLSRLVIAVYRSGKSKRVHRSPVRRTFDAQRAGTSYTVTITYK